MTKSYEERFLEEYTSCDKQIERLKEKVKKYNQIMDTLKQEEIKNILDDALKGEVGILMAYLKNDKCDMHDHTEKLIKQLSSETIFMYLNRKIYAIENYNIHGLENHKKLLLQIKDLGLVKNYYDVNDVASKMERKDVTVLPESIFECLINNYKNTDYISELKSIMNEELYIKLLNGKISFIEQFTRDPFGFSFTFDVYQECEIIPSSVRLNNLEDVTQINVNGHCLFSKEDMKNIGKYIEKRHNNILLSLKTYPNKIQRSIVYLVNNRFKMN